MFFVTGVYFFRINQFFLDIMARSSAGSKRGGKGGSSNSGRGSGGGGGRGGRGGRAISSSHGENSEESTRDDVTPVVSQVHRLEDVDLSEDDESSRVVRGSNIPEPLPARTDRLMIGLHAQQYVYIYI